MMLWLLCDYDGCNLKCFLLFVSCDVVFSVMLLFLFVDMLYLEFVDCMKDDVVFLW